MPWQDTQFEWYGAPGLVPAILAAILLFIGLILVMRSWKGNGIYKQSDSSQSTEPQEGSKDVVTSDDVQAVDNTKANYSFLKTERNRVIAVLIISAVYVFLLLGRIPYVAATAIFIAGFIFIFRGAGWLKGAIVAILTSTAVWLVFDKIFAVVLPG